MNNQVTITISGPTGSGKSAIAGEIEILCKALGLHVEWPAGRSEKNLTGADWTGALEMYKPSIHLVEAAAPDEAPPAAGAAQAVTPAAALDLAKTFGAWQEYTAGPIHLSADGWLKLINALSASTSIPGALAAAAIQEIEYGQRHGWPAETLKRLEGMAAAWNQRAALAATPAPEVALTQDDFEHIIEPFMLTFGRDAVFLKGLRSANGPGYRVISDYTQVLERSLERWNAALKAAHPGERKEK